MLRCIFALGISIYYSMVFYNYLISRLNIDANLHNLTEIPVSFPAIL